MFLPYLDFKKKILISVYFPTLAHLKVEWNVGFTLYMFVILQIITGVFLVFFFKMGMEECLISKSFMMKEISFGWMASYIHLITPNFVFFFLFIHIFKSMIFTVLNYSLVWMSGFIILFFFVIISFTGYALVLGSLGFWAIVVVIGIMEFLFGELVSFLMFSDLKVLSELLLFKIFTYHFIFSFLSIFLMYLHLTLVHFSGSTTGMYGSNFLDYFSFYSIFWFKDLIFLLTILFFYFYFFLLVEFFFSVDNFMELNIFEVPEEMNSEWYLSMVFIILSSVNSKMLGLIFTGLVFFMLVVEFFKFNFNLKYMNSKFLIFFDKFLILLLMLFTLGKFGGSFYLTSLFLIITGMSITEFFFISQFFSLNKEISFLNYKSKY